MNWVAPDLPDSSKIWAELQHFSGGEKQQRWRWQSINNGKASPVVQRPRMRQSGSGGGMARWYVLAWVMADLTLSHCYGWREDYADEFGGGRPEWPEKRRAEWRIRFYRTNLDLDRKGRTREDQLAVEFWYLWKIQQRRWTREDKRREAKRTIERSFAPKEC